MIWVPPGYSFGEPMFGLDEVRGGSGYGAGTFAGPTGARQPSGTELSYAEHQVSSLPRHAMAPCSSGQSEWIHMTLLWCAASHVSCAACLLCKS